MDGVHTPPIPMLTRKAGLIACNVMLCLLSGWLGILHGYFPARRLRTLLICIALVALAWLGYRWVSKYASPPLLVIALMFGALGTLSGLDIQAHNRFIEVEWQKPFVQRTHQLSTHCPALGLLPCRTHISLVRSEGRYYEIVDGCSIPYFFCLFGGSIREE